MKRKYISNMPIEGFSKYHICKNGRLYSIHSGTWRLIKPVAKSTGYISNNLISDSGKRANFYRHRNKLIYQYNIGILRKDILEEFRISTKLLYSILRKHNVKLRKS